MKTLLALSVVLASSSLAVAEPIHLGFGDRPAPIAARPLAIAALPARSIVSEDGGGTPLAAAPPRAETTIFGLPKNVGPGDRVLRTVIGAALLGTGIWGLSSSAHLSNTASGILIGVSAVPFATAATGYCPLYQAVGLDRSF